MKAFALMTIGRRLFLASAAVVMIVPFFDMLLGALRTPAERLAQPPTYWPNNPQWGNFARAMTETPILSWTLNSIIVTGSILIIQLVGSAAAGYALAKVSFRGRAIVLNLVLVAHIFPFFLLLVPTFFLLRAVPLLGGNDIFGTGGTGVLNGYPALILPFLVSWYGVFYMRQVLVNLPDDILDAARIDGASELKIFILIVLPIARPALWTLGIFIFAYHWNEVIWTMTVTRTAPELQTLPVGLHLLRGEFSDEIAKSLQQAVLALSIAPTILLYAIAWRFMRRGGQGLMH